MCFIGGGFLTEEESATNPPSSPMASLVEIKGNYYLQFYDSKKQPSRKKVALQTKRKRVAKKLQRRYEDAYALGEN